MANALKYVVFALVTLLGACSAPPPVPEASGPVDLSALSPEHAAIVEAALDAWRAATPEITAYRADGAPGAIRVTELDVETLRESAGNPDSMGYREGDAIVLSPCDTSTGEGYDACLHIAEHELGHAFGGVHVCDAHSVMYYAITDANAADPISDTDVREVVQHPIGGDVPAECNN
jgi:hypothetical protein